MFRISKLSLMSLVALTTIGAFPISAVANRNDGVVDGYISSVANNRYQRPPFAAVWAVNRDSGRTIARTTADHRGYYRMNGLPAGRYRIHARWRGQTGDSGNAGAWFWPDRPNYPARVNANVR